MAKQCSAIEPEHRAFIERQRIFFTGSAAHRSRVNVSPKDAASLRILSPHQVVYLDLTGSGNETAAHLLANVPRKKGCADGAAFVVLPGNSVTRAVSRKAR